MRVSGQVPAGFARAEREEVARKLSGNERLLLDYISKFGVEFNGQVYDLSIDKDHLIGFDLKSDRPTALLRNLAEKGLIEVRTESAISMVPREDGNGLVPVEFGLNDITEEFVRGRDMPYTLNTISLSRNGRLVLGAWHFMEQERIRTLVQEHRSTE